MSILDFFGDPLQYAFMQRAMIEVVIIGALTGLVGSLVVLRGLAFIGDALIHAVFPGLVVAALLGANILIGAFVAGALTTLLIGLLSQRRDVGHDSAIGVVFAGFLALGVVLASRQDSVRQDLMSFLFGNVLAISTADILITLAVAAVVGGLTLLFLRPFILVAFDRRMAAALGYSVLGIDLLLLLLVTATVVVSIQAVGNLLLLALLITPAAAARLLTDRLGRMIVASMAISIASGALGLLLSYHVNTPGGATIALTSTGLFVLALVGSPQHGVVARWLNARRGLHHEHHFHEEHEESEIG